MRSVILSHNSILSLYMKPVQVMLEKQTGCQVLWYIEMLVRAGCDLCHFQLSLFFVINVSGM